MGRAEMAEQIAASQVQVLVTRHNTEIIFTASILGLLVTPALMLPWCILAMFLAKPILHIAWIVASVGNFSSYHFVQLCFILLACKGCQWL